MKKRATYIDIEQACNSLYVTTEELMTILGGVSKGKADDFRMKLEEKLDNEKIKALAEEDETKRNKLLAHCFLDYVRREANKMRKAINIEKKGEIDYEVKTVS